MTTILQLILLIALAVGLFAAADWLIRHAD
jgi:hypothetical protein